MAASKKDLQDLNKLHNELSAELKKTRGELGALKLMHVKQSAQMFEIRDSVIHMSSVMEEALSKMGPVVQNLKEVNNAIEEQDDRLDALNKYMNELWGAVAVNSARIHNVANFVHMTPETQMQGARKKKQKK